MKEKIYLFIGLIIGALFLYIAAKDLNYNDLEYVKEHFNAWWIIPMLACATLFFVFKAIRWKLILDPVYKARITELYSSIMIGTTVGYIISVYLGEVVRTFCFAKQCKVSKSSILATVILERLFDLLILLLFFGIALIYTPELPFDAKRIGYIFSCLGITLFALMMFAVFKTDSCLKIVHWLSKWLPSQIQKGVVKQIDLGIVGLHSLKNPSLLFGIFITSLIGWFFMAFTNQFAMHVVGVSVPIYASFLIMGLIVVGMSLPNPPGSIGIIEWCYVVGLKPYGVDSGAAFASAIVFHLFLYASVILVGFVFAKRLHLTIRQAATDAASSEGVNK